MGCICGNPKDWSEEEQIFGGRLDTIDESLGEKGVPRFSPAIPRNHKELVIQHLRKCKGKAIRPNKDSKVKLHYSGWICEEGDLWRSQTAQSISRLATPFKLPSDIGLPSPNYSDESGKVFNKKSRSNSRNITVSLRDRLDTLTVHSPAAYPVKTISNESRSTTDKSMLYGKCYEHTESWVVQLGTGEVIDGLEEILLAISVGDEVIAFIPSGLAFGEQGLDQTVPPNADLVVQVSLKSIL